MKKVLLSLSFLFATSIVAHAQWTTNGTVTTTTNSVAIGTSTAPVSVFQVNSGPYKFSAGSAPQGDLNYGTSYIGFNAARIGTAGSANWTIEGDGSHNGGGVIYTDISGNIYLVPLVSTGTGSRTLTDLQIKSAIAFKVANNGAVYAKAVSVQTTGWPDYVFKKDYELPPLSELKNYVEQNQHLPGIPSAEEIAQNGQNLGEMNRLLLKKVEELTLYLIEKDKQDKELREQLGELKKQMQLLKKR